MQVDVQGTRLWFDVDGPALMPDDAQAAHRRTVARPPGTFDHSHFKPDLARLSRLASPPGFQRMFQGRHPDIGAWPRSGSGWSR
jgi:hypothetical protein